jgi:7-carboxy-7-deazaguanine synthase
MKPLPIHERFYAFQGEGDHMGRSAFFIRTFGCPVHCPWCDSAGTWHKDYVPKEIDKFTPEQLVDEVREANPAFAVFTGGEPTVHKQLPLFAQSIRDIGYPVHLETCGGFDFSTEAFDWITVSPKREQLPTEHNLTAASELKLIIDHPNAVDEWTATLNQIAPNWNAQKRSIWLHPEWSQRDNPAVLNAISKAIKNDEYNNFRAGYQLHKLYQVDALDKKTKPLAPLGGNLQNGY